MSVASGKILWLVKDGTVSQGVRMVVESTMRAEGLYTSQLVMQDIGRYASSVDGDMYAALEKAINVVKPSIIVCNDADLLLLFTNTNSLHNCRGSVYEYQTNAGTLIDVLVIDVLSKMFHIPYGRWMFRCDIQKLARFVNKKTRLQPKFVYTVCHTVHDIHEAEQYLLDCIVIAEDIETHPGRITCVGFTGWHKDGRVMTYVFPIWNPFRAGQRHFTYDVECVVWDTMRAIHASPVWKVMQNGSYDSSYFIAYNMPPVAYVLDTIHMFHSIYTEAPKKLNFIASIVLDYVQYWKDEAKGEESQRIRFKEQADLDKFWRYNALDNYYTLLSSRVLLAMMKNLPWALKNYSVEFPLQVGPCLHMTMQGLRVDFDRLDKKTAQWKADKAKALRVLRTMAADPEFEPTPAQVGHLIYKVLGAQPPTMQGKAGMKEAERQEKAEAKGKMASLPTDQNVLKLVANQHPIFEIIIKQIGLVKKPQGNISKYTPEEIYHAGRLFFSMHAAGTETGRLASRGHTFGFGTQVQNIPYSARDFVIADDGEVFFEPDYSQSDARFVAYESEDRTFIYNVDSGKDTHCLHAAHFFRPLTYDEINEGNKSGDPYFADEVTGIRSITKKIVHGKNYNMAGFTLFMQMGKKAAMAAARAKGHKPDLWDDRRFAKFCQTLLDDYDKMYPELAKWKAREYVRAAQNKNLVSVAFGRTRLFFGDVAQDKNTQREMSAYFGQGGTAGLINDRMLYFYYKEHPSHVQGKFKLYSQTHDSFLFAIKVEHMHEVCAYILTCMKEPVTIHGRSLSVPPDGKVGFAWGRGLVKYKPTLTIQNLQEAKDKLFAA